MGTRYFEMLTWTIQLLFFSIFLVVAYYQAEKVLRPIKIVLNNKSLLNIYLQDVLLVLFLIFIIGFRCNNGSDYYNYFNMYINVDILYSNLYDVITERFQNGYMILCYLVKSIIGGDYTIFFAIAVIIYVPTIRIFRKYSEMPVLSVFFWIFWGYLSMTTNIVKQSLAMVCVLMACFDLLEKRYFSFFLLSFLGCVFHLPTIFIIILFMIALVVKPSKKIYYIFCSAGICCCIFFNQIMSSVSKMLPSHYENYIQEFLSGNHNEPKLQLGAIVVTIFYLIILRVLIRRYETSCKKRAIDRYLFSVSLLCIPILFMGLRYYICNRIAYSGLQFLTICFPSYFRIYGKENNKKGDWKIVIATIIFSVLFTILCAENNYYHYSTIFYDSPLSIQEFVLR